MQESFWRQQASERLYNTLFASQALAIHPNFIVPKFRFAWRHNDTTGGVMQAEIDAIAPSMRC